jgi:hypothetical protein
MPQGERGVGMTDRFSSFFQQFAEDLARIEFEQWKHWASGLLAEEENLSEDRKARWIELFETDWDDLSDDHKNMDWIWVSQVLAVFERDPFFSFMNILELMLEERFKEGFVGEEVYDPLEHADRDIGVQLVENARTLIAQVRKAEEKKAKKK